MHNTVDSFELETILFKSLDFSYLNDLNIYDLNIHAYSQNLCRFKKVLSDARDVFLILTS